MTEVTDIFAQARFDTEQALLGGILSYGAAAYRQAEAIVKPEDFHDSFHAKLFEVIGEAVDDLQDGHKLVMAAISGVRDDKRLVDAKITANAMIGRYLAAADPLIAIEGGARQVRHDRLNVDLKFAVEAGETAQAETLAAEMERLSRAHLETDTEAEGLGTVSDRITDILNECWKTGKPVMDWVSCGAADLAYAISGWRRQRFYVIAGRPGMGKSTVAVALLLRTALKRHGVMFFSLEMTRNELSEMALCSLAWDPHRRVEYRDISSAAVSKPGFEEKFKHVLQVQPTLRSLPFMINDRAGATIAQIRSAAMAEAQRLQAQGMRLDVICIDHLGLIAASGKYSGNKAAETEEVSMSLKRLAKELDIAVIALVQLNRGVEGREDKRPSLADLRWSGAIEQDADVVMFVYREAYYLERRQYGEDLEKEATRVADLERKQHDMELMIAKNRGGPCRVIPLYCDMGCAAIKDKERDHNG
jgi:replicative DNA helicase